MHRAFQGKEVQNGDTGLGSKPHVGPGASPLASLGLSFLSCTMEIIITLPCSVVLRTIQILDLGSVSMTCLTGEAHDSTKAPQLKVPTHILANSRTAYELAQGPGGGETPFVELGPAESQGPGVNITFTKEDTSPFKGVSGKPDVWANTHGECRLVFLVGDEAGNATWRRRRHVNWALEDGDVAKE